MSIISSNLYKALQKAGVPEALSESASKEVAESTKLVLEQDNKLNKLESKVAIIDVKLNILIALAVGILIALLIK